MSRRTDKGDDGAPPAPARAIASDAPPLTLTAAELEWLTAYRGAS